MASQLNPDDPRRSNLAEDPYRSGVANQPYLANRDAARLDNELEADPELAEGPASGGKIAMFALAVAVVLGAVFYGLNNSTINQAGTASTAQTTTQSSPPAAPTGMRDVTPRGNTDSGMTTGAAPAQPAQRAPAPSSGTGNSAPK